MLNWLQNAFSSQVVGKIVSGKKNTSFDIKSRKLLCLIAIKEYSYRIHSIYTNDS